MANKIVLTDSAGRYISKLSNLIRRQLIFFTAQNDISAKEGLTLLFIIAQLAEHRNLYQKDIEEEYSIRPATATQLLQKMEQHGLIRREPDPEDGRMKRIIVADKALSYQGQLLKNMMAMEEKLVEGIGPEKLSLFFEVIKQMLDNMNA